MQSVNTKIQRPSLPIVERLPGSAIQASGDTSGLRGPRFDTALTPIVAPPASSYLTSAKLAITCTQALPMLAAIKYVVRPAPGLSNDAIESERSLPRQSDVLARQDAVTITREMVGANPVLLRNVTANNNLQWLASGFQLILGSGFFGMYQHAGVMRALAGLGLHESIQELCGLSSGAITGALYATLGPEGMTRELLALSILDFLDLSPTKFAYEGALCAGKAVERKIAQVSSQYGCTELENTPGVKLRIAVFDGFIGKTVWHTSGPLAQTIARSAALPVLFANEGYLDGGWVDHHGFTALRPNQRALSVRMNTGIEPDTMQKLVRRPKALFNVSNDAEHKTVALKPLNKVDGKSFLLDIDFRKEKLVNIVNESEEMFKWWLFQPSGSNDGICQGNQTVG